MEALIGPETINTLPMRRSTPTATTATPRRGWKKSSRRPGARTGLIDTGIYIDGITRQVEIEGIRNSLSLWTSFRPRSEAAQGGVTEHVVDSQLIHPGKASGHQALDGTAEEEASVERLWRKDPGLGKPDPHDHMIIRHCLGWLHVAGKMEEHARELRNSRGK